ncbi:MAG: B12-binding domain-containing radical SAM protein [Nitrospirae bacterium]|nr:B12-binding domain-containing radical SAM protein [Nitrospirota bacterium]
MKPEIIMIQPKTSLTGAFIRMIPLGLLYAASRVVLDEFPVQILDTRINPSFDESELFRLINKRTRIIGFSVMSGVSVTESLRLSLAVKAKYPELAIVWGGPHPTFSSLDVMQEKSIDYIIRGYGAQPFHELFLYLIGNSGCIPLREIKGLSWRDKQGHVYHNDIATEFEFINYRHIPYHIIPDMTVYKHVNKNDIVFPIYSVMGCPYQCAFCSSPVLYAKFAKKWMPYPVDEVVSHIDMVQKKYGATLIYFIDDDSFVDLRHVESIIDEIKKRGINIKLGFRGARINEILTMSDSFLNKLADAGTNTMHIGAESGCNRLLSLMRKNITAEQILEANLKLARHTNITAYYNFIVGFPTETLEETKMTRNLILQLIKDNPQCIVIPLNKPRPLPGTELYELAVLHGYSPPDSLEKWGIYELEASDYNPVWMTKEHNKFIRMMFLCMYFIDGKIFKMASGQSLKYALLKILAWFYRPVANFRFRNGLYQFLIEERIYGMIRRLL